MDKQVSNLGLREHDSIQSMVVKKKYCLGDEQNYQDVINRVASQIHDEELAEWLRTTDKFIPAGSILSGAGNEEYKCSLSNCYFTPIEEDSIEGIMDCCKRMARTYSYRGGTGINLTVLRPKGMRVNNSARESSGAVSFMPLFSEVTNTIGQSGRRGALMIMLDVRHPDILDFIWSKSKPEQVFGKDVLTGRTPDVFGANISVALSDDFMKAVENDEEWVFKFPDREADPDDYDSHWEGVYEDWTGEWKEYFRMSAREVMKQIAESAWISGDPGVAFMGAIKDLTPGSFIHELLVPKGTNPCGEQPLHDYGNCLLGAIVLHKYVQYPWTEYSRFDYEMFVGDMEKVVKVMNCFSDINEHLHPLEEQRLADRFSKRIGIEFTGLADCLAMLGMEYGDKLSLGFVADLMKRKAFLEIKVSNKLAKEKGCCPALETRESRENFLDSPYIKGLDLCDWLQEHILDYGLRNTAFNTVGPTGSISIVAGNCSSGIEPIYAMSYRRTTRLADEPFTFIHRPALEWMESVGEYLPPDMLKEKLNYVESHELSWRDRLQMQSVVQRYTDSAISSTVNLPETATPEEIMDIYHEAWKLSLKGVTVFRDGCKKGVLDTGEKDEKPVREAGLYIRELLETEKAERHRVFWKGAKVYITVSLDEEDNPVEVFVKLPREAGINGDGYYREEVHQEKSALWDVITRLITAHLRAGMPLEYVIKQLDKGSYTLTDAGAVLSRILKKYMYKSIAEEQEENGIGDECPECGEMAYVYTGGCPVCQQCGYSKC